MSDTAYKIKVMQAYEDGAEIEFSDNVGVSWHEATSPRWDWANRDYRIKPQPKDIWVNEYHLNSVVHRTKERAISKAVGGITRAAVHYREVIDE